MSTPLEARILLIEHSHVRRKSLLPRPPPPPPPPTRTHTLHAQARTQAWLADYKSAAVLQWRKCAGCFPSTSLTATVRDLKLTPSTHDADVTATTFLAPTWLCLFSDQIPTFPQRPSFREFKNDLRRVSLFAFFCPRCLCRCVRSAHPLLSKYPDQRLGGIGQPRRGG